MKSWAIRSFAGLSTLTILATTSLAPMAEAGDRYRRHHHHHGHGSVEFDSSDALIIGGLFTALFAGEAYRRHRQSEVLEQERRDAERRERELQYGRYEAERRNEYRDDYYTRERGPEPDYAPDRDPAPAPDYRYTESREPAPSGYRPSDQTQTQLEGEYRSDRSNLSRDSQYDPDDIRHPDNAERLAAQQEAQARRLAEAAEADRDAAQDARDARENSDEPVIVTLEDGRRIYQPRVHGARAILQQWSDLEERWVDIREYPSVY